MPRPSALRQHHGEVTMTKRRCRDCPTLVEQGVRGGRCQPCAREHDRARGGREERGYGAEHRAERARLQSYMDAGVVYECWRCLTQGRLRRIDPSNWHLGHCDIDRSKYHGPECPRCNNATRGRTGCPHPTHH